MTTLDVEPRHLDTVRTILRRHVPEYEVRAFGSRVHGRPRKFSDLDLRSEEHTSELQSH